MEINEKRRKFLCRNCYRNCILTIDERDGCITNPERCPFGFMDGLWEESIPCQHGKIVRQHDSAVCAKCGKDFGWWCPKSPDHCCHYSKSYDSCDFCGEPEERK